MLPFISYPSYSQASQFNSALSGMGNEYNVVVYGAWYVCLLQTAGPVVR